MAENLVHGWPPVYPHLRYREPVEAIAWLTRAFGLRELVRMATPDGSFITSKLETPGGGGLVMIAGSSPEFAEWMRERVPDFREGGERPFPYLTHTTSVLVDDVDAHYARALGEGAAVLGEPKDQPWGLRTYAAIDLEGHQWEFGRVLGAVEPEDWGARRVG